MELLEAIAKNLELPLAGVAAVVNLIEDDATVPFIARYRKEATGSLDEVAVTAIRDELGRLKALEERRLVILNSLEKNAHLTPELEAKVLQAQTLSALEDIYLPFKPKRRTRAMIAREKGLEPLADLIFEQTGCDPEKEAQAFVDEEKGVADIRQALAGARDIIAERIAEDADARAALRDFFFAKASFSCSVIEGKEQDGAKFADYFDWAEPIFTCPSHRVLAMRRGEKEGILDLAVQAADEQNLAILSQHFVKGQGADSQQVRQAMEDAYSRLLFRAMETEVRLASKNQADIEAVRVFAQNLRHLLLAPPLGQKRVLAIDPGLRTGCKTVVLDAQGNLLLHDVLWPHSSQAAREQSAQRLNALVKEYGVESIAVGNGTAGRETEAFVRQALQNSGPPVFLVDESGASVYSASEIARSELPDYDLTVRGAVSIGRRLVDPLAELVKIDPKSIGVGQYQHDVDQNLLKTSLDDTVISCVNAVGVDVNTASPRLLQYVSGLSQSLSENIVAKRKADGPFASREQLKAVPRLGPKTFEQAAGFLRISGGENPLDASAVHPERYSVVEKMAADLGCTVSNLMTDSSLRSRIDLQKYVSGDLGLPTLSDIMAELEKPGRDPRPLLEVFSFRQDIHEMADLKEDMELPGIVTNVTAFGAFVDVGVHQDGLVHVSEMAERFVKDPSEIVQVGKRVKVRVLHVDMARGRIALSLRRKSSQEARELPDRTPTPQQPAAKSGRPGFRTKKSGQ
ncbi:MAG: Tex family protein, partial [Desulfatibacillaceae bacterium]|nr:Tex family protein [Desulfatibacillaceae bacterium]